MIVTAIPTDPESTVGLKVVACPSVTLWAPTTPARHLTEADRRCLAHLADIAVERLRVQHSLTALAPIQANLLTALGSAGAAGTDKGIVVHVSSQRCESMLLPYAPRPQSVVEPIFGTGDLAGMMNLTAEPSEFASFPGPTPAEPDRPDPN